MAEVLLGVAGGVAAYKAAYLTSRLAQDGHGVSVVMTAAARRFVGEATFAALSGRPVIGDTFDQTAHPLGPHIELARAADVFAVVPATAHVMAKAAHGLADDLLSTLLLSFTGPLLIAPAMNAEMWRKPAVQRNLKQLRDDGAHIAEPSVGWQSCRDSGPGRMAEPDEIAATIVRLAMTGPTPSD